jgi:hypothetical protein
VRRPLAYAGKSGQKVPVKQSQVIEIGIIQNRPLDITVDRTVPNSHSDSSPHKASGILAEQRTITQLELLTAAFVNETVIWAPSRRTVL